MSCILPTPSVEQQIILNSIKDGKNIIVEALAGSGKTTLILHTIVSNPEKKGFMISYNRGLVDQTNTVIGDLEHATGTDIRSRITVVTYHSLLSMICNKVIDDDLLFLVALTTTDFSLKRASLKFKDFDFMIIDECQDMRGSYFTLVINVIVQLCILPKDLQMLVVGDTIQLLYNFYAINRADSRFLTCMDQLLVGTTQRQWEHKTLTTSYRSTQPIANFINSLFKQRITIPKPASIEERQKEAHVTIYILDLYKDCPMVILPHIQRSNLSNRSSLIICSSLNERSPAVGIVDLLVMNNIDVHVARSGKLSDNGSSHMNQSTTQNKVLMKTKHGVKGLEADDVHTVCNVNVFDYYNKPLENAEYVAFSRARKQFFLYIDYRNVNEYQLQKYLQDNNQLTQKDLRIIQLRDIKPNEVQAKAEDEQKVEEQKQQTNFTSNTLFSFIDVSHLQFLLKMLEQTEIQAPLTARLNEPNDNDNDEEQDELKAKQMEGYFHQMNVTFDHGKTYINVTNICGIAITMALEYTITKCIPVQIHNMMMACLARKSDEKCQSMRKRLELVIRNLRQNNNSATDAVLSQFKLFAEMGTLLDAYTGYCEKLNSLKNFDFINTSPIFERYRVLHESLSLIIGKHNIAIADLIWYKKDIGRFKYDDKSIMIVVEPTLVSKCGSLLIDVVHTPCISHEHHLSALVAAQVIGNAHTSVYVVNIGDGNIQKSQLNSHTNEDSMNFISQAITFKLCKEDNPDDANFIGTHHKFVCESVKQRSLFDR